MGEPEGITGAEKLTDIFGYWPSFHDAEVLWIRLDRLPYTEQYGPVLEAVIHAFEITSEVDPDGFYVVRHHVRVHLRFEGVTELQLEGFNNQNALMGLGVKNICDRQMENIRWEVQFDSSWGVTASFRCYSAEIVGVTPCNKEGDLIT